MRTAIAVVFAVALTAGSAVNSADAQERERGAFGLGIIVGSPTGLSAEYTLGGTSSLHFALGVDGIDNNGRDNDFYLHAMWKFYLAELTSTADFSLPLYVGVGPFISDIGDDNIGVGARGPFGIAFSFNTVPIDIFVEIPLYLQIVEDVDIAVGVALGFHYFF